MYDKARLFNYRRASRVNVYRLGDYDDYFYGYMVMSTRYLKYFDLQMYEEGFILRLPNKKQPKAIQPFHPQKKLFDVQQEAEKLGHKLGVFDVGTLNDRAGAHERPDPDAGGAAGKEDRRYCGADL